MFSSLGKVVAEFICEDCYRAHFYGQDLFIKSYKHRVLANAITLAASRKICRCNIVPHFDTSGRSRMLFPVDKEEEHLDIDGTGGIRGILKLGELVALAKYDGMQTVVDKRRNPSDRARSSKDKREDGKAKHERYMTKATAWRGHRRRDNAVLLEDERVICGSLVGS